MSAPRELGGYALVDRLGRGGMGEVWRAYHASLARPAAVKLVRPEALGATDEVARGRLYERFLREAQFTAQLTSMHTVRLFDFGRAPDGTLYYAMELLHGLDLDALVERFGPLDPRRAVRVLSQACDSLAEAHARGLVHRDIKPANLFLCRQGIRCDVLKVTDFGLVKLAEPSTTALALTVSNSAVGTPAFMAPEMARGESDAIDGRTDLYALGCVAYWLLTGQLVFAADSAIAMALAHTRDLPAPPSAVSEVEVPSGLERIVMALLEKSPEDRPHDASAVREALGALDLPPWTDQDAERWWRLHLSDLLVMERPRVERTAPSLRAQRIAPRAAPAEDVDAATTAVAMTSRGLPRKDAPLLGRERELESLSTALVSTNLVTLVGPAGVGKTHMALDYAASRLNDLPEAVYFADLTSVDSLETACSCIADAFGVPLASAAPIERLSDVIGARGPLLLLLDGADRVVPTVAELMRRCLAESPRAATVVTSRERLGVAGETVLRVTPLETPSREVTQAERALKWPAVALFVATAKQARPGFELTDQNVSSVVAIVELLDGLPLAIALAAARMRILSAKQIHDRLVRRFDILRSDRRDLPARQATLLGALDWSWQLLEPWERSALAQSGVFQSRFRLETAESVIDLSNHAEGPWLPDVLQALVDKSLLRFEPPRRAGDDPWFQLDQTVREYALLKLASDPTNLDVPIDGVAPETVRPAAARHAALQAALCRAWLPDKPWQNPDHASEGTRLGSWPDLAAAVRTACICGREDWATPVAVACGDIAQRRGPLSEAVVLTKLALDVTTTPRYRLPLLYMSSRVCRYAGQLEVAYSLAGEAAELARQSNEDAAQSFALLQLGLARYSAGRVREAESHYRKAIDLARSVGDDHLVGAAALALGTALHHEGRPQEGTAQWQEAAQSFGRVGDAVGKGLVLNNVGWYRLHHGEPELAGRTFEAALKLHEASGRDDDAAYARSNLGLLDWWQGRFESARAQLEASLEQAHALGELRAQAGTLYTLGLLEITVERPEKALEHFRSAQRLTDTLGDSGFHAMVTACAAVAQTRLHQVAAATESIVAARHGMEGSADRLARALTLRALGEAELASGDPEQALRDIDDALTEFRRLERPLDEADSLLIRAEIALAAEEPGRARNALDQAAQRVESISLADSAPFWARWRRLSTALEG